MLNSRKKFYTILELIGVTVMSCRSVRLAIVATLGIQWLALAERQMIRVKIDASSQEKL